MATIMTVDDCASMRQLVAFTLQSVGHDVVEAVDGSEAVGIARDKKIDLMIVDVNMPNMDGLSFVKSVRGMPSHKFTPILMLTTEAEEHKRQQGRAAGATGWIVKPFSPEQLLSVVKKVLN